MMEYFGYKITLAGLFQECIDAVEGTRPHQALDPASRLLDTRFLAAKDLFKQWGSHLGLAAEHLSKAAVDDRFDHKTAANVKEVLDIVKSICDGDNPYLPVCSIFDTVLHGATGKCAPKNERKKNLKWMFRDKANQSDHVELFELIVQRLHEWVPVETSTTHIRSKGFANTTVVEMERIMARIENQPQDGREEFLPWVSRELGLDDVVDNLLRGNNLSSEEEEYLEDEALSALLPEQHDLLMILLDEGVDLRLSDSNNWTLLHHAVWFDFTESIELLIERGADVEAKTRMGNTALHLAQSAEAVETLVKLGADLDALNCKDETPLISACIDGLVYVAEQLVNEGTTLTSQDNHKRTALHSACWGGHSDIVLSCLEEEAEVEVFDEDEETPIHLACFAKDADIVQLLIEAAADTEAKDSYGRAPLNRACYDGLEDIAKVLLESECDVDTTGPGDRTPLYVAVLKGHLGIVKLLVERGANLTALNDEGLAPLHAAAGCGHVEIAKVLLDAGADVMIRGKDGSTPLHHSGEPSAPELWRLLVDSGADIMCKDGSGYMPLHWASMKGNAKAVSFLLGKGANALAVTSSHHKSTLHCAAHGGSIEVVKLLLEKGVKLDQGDESGQLPLEEAVAVGTAEVVEFILQQSPEGSISVCDSDTGSTLLHQASIAGNVDVVRLLLQNPGVQPGRVDKLERTSLLLASVQGNEEVVRMLLADGRIRPDVQDWYGSTALFAAVRNAHTGVAKILLEAEGGNADGKDGFGHDLFWWARGTGNAKMLELLTEHLGERGNSGAANEPTGRPPPTQVNAGMMPYCDACLVRSSELEECSSRDNWSFSLCQDCHDMFDCQCSTGINTGAEDSSSDMSE